MILCLVGVRSRAALPGELSNLYSWSWCRICLYRLVREFAFCAS